MLAIVADEPVFETGLLLAGPVNPSDMRRQLVRWTQARRLHQLRARALRAGTALPPNCAPSLPRRQSTGARLLCQRSVGVGPRWCDSRVRAGSDQCDRWASQLHQTPLGRFSFRHLKTDLLYGYQHVELVHGQSAFVAAPEKALLDLIYLQPNGDTPAYINELRLDWGSLDLAELDRLVAIAARPKLLRAVRCIRALAQDAVLGYEPL